MKHLILRFSPLCLASLLLFACQNKDPLCGAGFHLEGGACVADRAVDAGFSDAASDVLADVVDAAGDVSADAGPDALSDGSLCEGDCPDGQQCRADGVCVTCLLDSECTEASASVCGVDGECTGCTEGADIGCAGVVMDETELPVCREGTCVQCTGADESACGDNVCDVPAGACTELAAGSARACEECVSDRQCDDGKVCVAQEGVLDEGGTAVIGHFCQWDLSAPIPGPDGACSRVPPFVVPSEALTTVSGATTDTCALTFATCPAYRDFRTDGDAPSVVPATCTMDSECGAAGFADGVCRVRDAASSLCTMPCVGAEDCTRFESGIEFGCIKGECGFTPL